MAQNQADYTIGDEYAKYRNDVSRAAHDRLAKEGIDFAARDIDTFYNRAWHGIFSRRWAGGEIENIERLLTESTCRQAVDEHRVLHPETRMDAEVIEAVGIAAPIEETPEQQRLQREFSARMRATLNQRELQAVTLCLVYGFKAFDAADVVGVGAFRIAGLLGDVIEELETVLEPVPEGQPCEELAPLINQYALGVLDPRSGEYRSAFAHVKDCPGCRRHAIGVRGLTAITNPTGTMLRAITGSVSLGVATVTTDAARRAPSPLRTKPSQSADAPKFGRGRRMAILAGVVAAVILGLFALTGQFGADEEAALSTAQSPEAAAAAAARAAEARAAQARAALKAKAAARRAEARRAARARARSRARSRARARARARAAARRAARANAVARTPQVQPQAPVIVQPQAPAAPAPKPKPKPKPKPPKPSTDPSQEFDVP
ncbi:MAG: hypothetical protein JHD02_08985 [Thermoleophilaceae bacterium]|nr:hypothetical protein [Thermoleophilaceae bacterium]